MKKKIAFIINPKSGTSNKKELPQLIRETMDDKWEEPTITFTEYAGHGYELAQLFAKEKYDVVVACGGDGTMNEIASGLVHTDTAFAIVPFGSGNGLARHLGYSMTPKLALMQINRGEEIIMDYGIANDKKFFCTCGTGFDAHISHSVAVAKQRGFLSYLKIIIKEYFGYHSNFYKINLDCFSFSRRAFLVTFANASQYGNMAYIAPHASTQDGIMDICILDTFPIYSIPKLAYLLLKKEIDKSRHISILHAKSATLIREKEGEFHIDGEAVNMGKEIHVKIVHNGIKVII